VRRAVGALPRPPAQSVCAGWQVQGGVHAALRRDVMEQRASALAAWDGDDDDDGRASPGGL
jgi:hypothetical protein